MKPLGVDRCGSEPSSQKTGPGKAHPTLASEFDPAPGRTSPPTPDGRQWTVYEYPSVSSTNLVAAGLPAWTAVRADTQTQGRGRFQRRWISDLGGLWLSAVVPIAEQPSFRRALPLATGLAIACLLHELGVADARLRWPNDVLVRNRKLAGVLIDQFVAGLAVVGVGLNVRNAPEARDPGLANRTIRLADLISAAPDLPELAQGFLQHLNLVLSDLSRTGLSPLLGRINRLWGPPRTVELDLDGTVRRGRFTGVDPEGRLALADADGTITLYEAPDVRHLTEI